jgi:hypothetical protein
LLAGLIRKIESLYTRCRLGQVTINGHYSDDLQILIERDTIPSGEKKRLSHNYSA